MKIGIVGGTGDQGLGLALRFAKAGEEVLIGSRDLKKAENSVNLLKNMLKDQELSNVTGMTNAEAAEQGELVILTVPLQAQTVTLASIKDHINNKILVDATVPLESCI